MIATTLGILLHDDEVLTCPDGELSSAIIEEGPAPGPRLGCLPPPTRPRACPAFAVAEGDACTSFREPGQALLVDAARWMRAVIGPDGGPAAPPLCNALRRSAGALAYAATVDLRVEVALSFPDNDVSQVVAAVGGAGAPAAELERVVAPLVEALRSVGGTANPATIAASVTCRRSSSRPVTQIR